jgi:chromosome segregation ATPase
MADKGHEESQIAERAGERASAPPPVQELEALRRTVNDQLEHIEALQARNEALATRANELRLLLERSQADLRLRDERLERKERELVTRRDEELKACDEEIHWLRAVVADLETELAKAPQRRPWQRALVRLRRQVRPGRSAE